MLEKVREASKFHLAGIVPVSGQKLDFNMPWQDCLMPVAQDYLAVENAVVQCAYAGCESIWLVLHDDAQPLIKHRLGDYVEDPLYVTNRFKKFPSEYSKKIPIYYVSIHPHDRDKRDCMGWAMMYGAEVADDIIARASNWLRPDKFFVSFPYGLVSQDSLHENRSAISSKKNVCFSFDGKTVKDNEYLPFTFTMEDCREVMDRVKVRGTGRYYDNQWFDRKNELPLEDRYSARFFDFEEVLQDFEPQVTIEVSWYHKIDSWDTYCDYIANGQSKVDRPYKRVLSPRKLSPVGVDSEVDN